MELKHLWCSLLHACMFTYVLASSLHNNIIMGLITYEPLLYSMYETIASIF